MVGFGGGMQVEIAQAFRLSNNQIDVIGFSVPRAKVRHPTRALARRLVLTSGCVCVCLTAPWATSLPTSKRTCTRQRGSSTSRP